MARARVTLGSLKVDVEDLRAFNRAMDRILGAGSIAELTVKGACNIRIGGRPMKWEVARGRKKKKKGRR